MTAQAKAWYVTTAAIARGQLVRPEACGCGNTVRVEAHHDDYADPLNVKWLCRKCHRARHYELGQQPPRYRNRFQDPSTLTVEKVRAALIAADGSPTRAAAMLKVSRQTIHAWMRKHHIRVERRVVLIEGEAA